MKYLRVIGSRENLQFEYIYGAWPESLDRLYSRKCTILPAIAYAEWREKHADFSSETVLSNWGRVCARNGLQINSMLDLQGLTVAVMSDDIYFARIVKLLASFGVKCRFVSLKSYNEALAAVANRQADAAVVSRFAVIDKKFDGLVHSTPLVFAPIELRFGFAKGTDKRIIDFFDKYVREMKNDRQSVYHKAINRWVNIPSVSNRERNVWTVAVVGISVLLVGFVFVFLAARDRILSGEERRKGDRRAVRSRRSEDVKLEKDKSRALAISQFVGDAIIVVNVESGLVTHTCGGFYDLFGYENESVTGSDLSRLSDDNRLDDHLKQCLANISDDGFDRTCTFKAVHSCGHVFEVEGNCSIGTVLDEECYVLSIRAR